MSGTGFSSVLHKVVPLLVWDAHIQCLYFNQVIIAAELLKNADELVKQKIHPTSIIGGYRLACK